MNKSNFLRVITVGLIIIFISIILLIINIFNSSIYLEIIAYSGIITGLSAMVTSLFIDD